MGPRVCTLAVLVLLLVAVVEAHRKPGHATRHGGSGRAAHRTSKAGPAARKATRTGGSEELPLQTLKATNIITFDFGDNGTLEEELKANGRYDPKMVFAYDMTMDVKRGHIFVSTPLVRRSIPATLSTIPFDGEIDPPLTPYPSLEIHATTEDTISDCNSQLVDIVTTVKTWGDDDTLYAIDNGVLDIVTTPKPVCPPKIVVFDLLTDKVKSTVVIENAACNALYTALWVDACPDGSLTAYASDTLGNVLTVTDLATGASKHLHSQYFYPKPGYFFIKAGGPLTYMPYGTCGVTTDQSCDGKVYVQALATDIQGAVDKHVIHDANDGDVLDVITQVDLPGRLSGASGEMVVDPTGQLLFFPILDNVAVYCLNTSKPHDPQNFRMIAQDHERLAYVSSLNIETETQRLYLVSDRFTSFLSNTTDYSDINYRILYIDIKDLQC